MTLFLIGFLFYLLISMQLNGGAGSRYQNYPLCHAITLK